MAKKTKACYDAPAFKKGDKEFYNHEVESIQHDIDDVAKKIYNDDFPSDRKCSKSFDCFTGCTPIIVPDQRKEEHLEQIRYALENIFMRGRMFGLMEGRYQSSRQK